MQNHYIDKESNIFATAVLKANKNILSTPVLTTENIKTFKVNEQTKKGALEILQKLGFTIEAVNDLTISISASKKTFEKQLGVSLTEKEINGVIYYSLSKPFTNAAIKKYINEIVFADAIELF